MTSVPPPTFDSSPSGSPPTATTPTNAATSAGAGNRAPSSARSRGQHQQRRQSNYHRRRSFDEMASLLNILAYDEVNSDAEFDADPQEAFDSLIHRTRTPLSRAFDALVTRQLREWGVVDDEYLEWTQSGTSREDDEGDGYEYLSWLGDFIGKVERGVNDVNNVATKLASVPISNNKESGGGDTDASDEGECDCCPICLESFKAIVDEGKSLRKVIVCNHTFCDVCLSTWLTNNRKCPVCMTELEG